MAGVNKGKNNVPRDSSGKSRRSTGLIGLYRRHPVPFKFLEPSSQNGPVKITKPANKEKS